MRENIKGKRLTYFSSIFFLIFFLFLVISDIISSSPPDIVASIERLFPHIHATWIGPSWWLRDACQNNTNSLNTIASVQGWASTRAATPFGFPRCNWCEARNYATDGQDELIGISQNSPGDLRGVGPRTVLVNALRPGRILLDKFIDNNK